MNQERINIKKIMAVFFAIFLIVMFALNFSAETFRSLADYFRYGGDNSLRIDKIESAYSDGLIFRKDLIEINGFMADVLNMHGLYSGMGMFVTDDKYIVSSSDYTSTDYEVEQTVSFNEFLGDNGIHLLYVNEPTKYANDSLLLEEFGVDSYSNRNADLFLERVNSCGVHTIDLRTCMAEENKNYSEMFYRTDHHWNVPSGLWAAEKMAEGLNRYCDYNIDLNLYSPERFCERTWQECWLGEQGRKMAKAYVGLDDFTELKPDYETSFTFKKKDGSTKEDSFDFFIKEDVYNTENDVYDNPSWHYSYKRTNSINHNVDYGKVLLLGDSYDYVTQPFLALGVHELDSLILRDCDDSFDLRGYILENQYDTVIVAYAEFMIGAHDDITSANYRMFTFE